MTSARARSVVAPLVALACLNSACSGQITAPIEVMLESFEFVLPEVGIGDPLLLVGRSGEDLEGPLTFTARTSEGESRQGEFRPRTRGRSPWEALTDHELTVVIDKLSEGHQVFIGFKEAGADRGTDENGQSVTSEETVERMKTWLTDQGVTIEYESQLLPTVIAVVPIDTELIARIRDHENVDYLEPAAVPSVRPEGADDQGGTRDHLAVVLTNEGTSESLPVTVGETVTAEYVQPNGSVMAATAVIVP